MPKVDIQGGIDLRNKRNTYTVVAICSLFREQVACYSRIALVSGIILGSFRVVSGLFPHLFIGGSQDMALVNLYLCAYLMPTPFCGMRGIIILWVLDFSLLALTLPQFAWVPDFLFFVLTVLQFAWALDFFFFTLGLLQFGWLGIFSDCAVLVSVFCKSWLLVFSVSSHDDWLQWW